MEVTLRPSRKRIFHKGNLLAASSPASPVNSSVLAMSARTPAIPGNFSLPVSEPLDGVLIRTNLEKQFPWRDF